MATARRSPVLILLLLCALPAFAQVADPPTADSATAESSSAESKSTELPKPSSDCGGETRIETEGLDTMRAGLELGVCSTARFVDRLFGGDRQFAEYDDEASGRASVTVGWNEQDGVEVDTRFRASVNLPKINERFNATIGKASSDEYIADEIGVFNPAVSAFSDDDPAEWFAGVGYRAHRTRDSRFDLGAGVKLESPLNPYANARYRRYFYPSPDMLFTLRTTFFVENDEGFGVTQAFDVDKILSPAFLLRFSNSVRWSEKTRGMRWRFRPALYQTLDYRRAMRYEAFVRGETDGTEPDLYGVGITHRRSMWREWFFLEFGAELFWADGPEPADRCSSCLGASIGVEILFGDLYDRLLRRDAKRLPEEEESIPKQ
jgi:hypothetical protein